MRVWGSVESLGIGDFEFVFSLLGHADQGVDHVAGKKGSRGDISDEEERDAEGLFPGSVAESRETVTDEAGDIGQVLVVPIFFSYVIDPAPGLDGGACELKEHAFAKCLYLFLRKMLA